MSDHTKAFHVAFNMPTDRAELIEDLAWEHHCLCVTHQPPHEDAWPAEISSLPVARESVSQVSFQRKEEASAFQSALADRLGIAAGIIEEEILPWFEYHKPYALPFDIGRLHIIPDYPEQPGACAPMTVYLPAGVGFGTGRHETTATCLELMQSIDLENKDVIDFGCGSGILAIAALLLGARHTWLHDHDLQAMKAAEQHLINHSLRDKSTMIEEASALPTVDVLFANILYEILCELKEKLDALTKSGGTAIFSGILIEQESGFLERFQGWTVRQRLEKNQWCSFVMTKD